MLRGLAAAGLGLLAPVRGGPAARGEVALEVHAHDVVPLRLGHVDEHAVAQDAGVVDEDVEVAERVDRRVDEPLGALPVGDVVAVGDGLAAQRLDLGSTTCRAAGLSSAPAPSFAPPRSLTTTLAPSAANSRACSRPSPRPAPVMIATRPSRDPISPSFQSPGGNLTNPAVPSRQPRRRPAARPRSVRDRGARPGSDGTTPGRQAGGRNDHVDGGAPLELGARRRPARRATVADYERALPSSPSSAPTSAGRRRPSVARAWSSVWPVRSGIDDEVDALRRR